MSDLSSLPGRLPPTPEGRAPAPGAKAGDAQDRALRDAAQKLEATFLTEMLKAAGLGKTRGSFGGGAGEDQFASFLRQAQAEEMVKAGGIGMAESLYQALKERTDDF